VALPLPHHTICATWHNVRLTRGNFNFLKKILKKNLKILKIKKENQKYHVMTRGT